MLDHVQSVCAWMTGVAVLFLGLVHAQDTAALTTFLHDSLISKHTRKLFLNVIHTDSSVCTQFDHGQCCTRQTSLIITLRALIDHHKFISSTPHSCQFYNACCSNVFLRRPHLRVSAPVYESLASSGKFFKLSMEPAVGAF